LHSLVTMPFKINLLILALLCLSKASNVEVGEASNAQEQDASMGGMYQNLLKEANNVDFSLLGKDQFRPLYGEHFEGDLKISQGMIDYYYENNNAVSNKIE